MVVTAAFAAGCNAGKATDDATGGGSGSSKTTAVGSTSGFGPASGVSTSDASSSTGMLEPLFIEPMNPTLDVVYGVSG